MTEHQRDLLALEIIHRSIQPVNNEQVKAYVLAYEQVRKQIGEVCEEIENEKFNDTVHSEIKEVFDSMMGEPLERLKKL